ncbi:TPA: hypothetical protein ACH3X2_000865 [Trebouxia sp. C0005]
MLECGPACSCGLQCLFRESQRGLSVVVALQSSDKGMSVIAGQNIDQGQFVAQYAGEMLTNIEADRRLAEYDATRAGVGHALLVPHAAGREGDPSIWHSMPTVQH